MTRHPPPTKKTPRSGKRGAGEAYKRTTAATEDTYSSADAQDSAFDAVAHGADYVGYLVDTADPKAIQWRAFLDDPWKRVLDEAIAGQLIMVAGGNAPESAVYVMFTNRRDVPRAVAMVLNHVGSLGARDILWLTMGDADLHQILQQTIAILQPVGGSA